MVAGTTREALPARRQDAFAQHVQLGHHAIAVLVDEEQRDQHEQHGQQQLEHIAGGGQHHAIDVAQVFAADGLDQRAQRVGLANVGQPVFRQSLAQHRHGRDQAGTSTP